MSLYETDFYTWARQQAELVRLGKFDQVDRDHLAEEIESLGNSEERSLQSCYRLIMTHLLKIIHQPHKRTDSWNDTVMRERSSIEPVIADSPGLKPKRQELFKAAYTQARNRAAKETGLYQRP